MPPMAVLFSEGAKMKIINFGTLKTEDLGNECDELLDFGEEEEDHPELPSLYDGTIPKFDTDDIYLPTDGKKHSVEKIVDHNCRLMESETERRFHDLADKSQKDSLMIRFASMRDMMQFENYYLRCYSFRGQAGNVSFGEYSNGHGHFVMTDNEKGRDAVYKIIVQLFDGDSYLHCDSILALGCIVHEIHERMEYNERHTTISLIESVVMETGVCWHFSRIAAVLLNYVGIPTRIVTGLNSEGYGHCWCESDIDGQLYTVDATSGDIWPGRYKHFMEQIVC